MNQLFAAAIAVADVNIVGIVFGLLALVVCVAPLILMRPAVPQTKPSAPPALTEPEEAERWTCVPNPIRH